MIRDSRGRPLSAPQQDAMLILLEQLESDITPNPWMSASHVAHRMHHGSPASVAKTLNSLAGRLITIRSGGKYRLSSDGAAIARLIKEDQ